MMNKLSNEDLPANADSVSQSTDEHKSNNTNGEPEWCLFLQKKKKLSRKNGMNILLLISKLDASVNILHQFSEVL